MEAQAGLEPAVLVLQTSAFPLGYCAPVEVSEMDGCHMVSGGPDGVWCIDHDSPWTSYESLVCDLEEARLSAATTPYTPRTENTPE
jgi:hypothetical protein